MWLKNTDGRVVKIDHEAHITRLQADGWTETDDPTIERKEVTVERDTTNDNERLDNGSEKPDSRRSIDVPTVHRSSNSKRTGHKS